MEGAGHIHGLASIVTGDKVSAAQQVSSTTLNNQFLQRFTAGTVLRGIVQSTSANNQVTINTAHGDITIHTDVFLKRGADITMRMQHQGGEPHVRIISVDGQPLPRYLHALQKQHSALPQDTIKSNSTLVQQSTATPHTPDSTAPQQASGQTETIHLSYDAKHHPTLRGVFLGTPDMRSISEGVLPPDLRQAVIQAQAGTSLQIRITNITLPPPATSQQLMPPQATVTTATPSAIPTTHLPIAQPTTSLTPASTSASQFVNVPANPATLTNAANHIATAPTVLEAVVVNASNPRELTLNSSLGHLKLFVADTMPKGTIITFTLEQVTDVRSQPTKQLVPPPAALSSETLDALRDIKPAAFATHPASSPTLFPPPSSVPQQGVMLGSEMLFLLMALKQGSIREWLGNAAMQQLDNTKPASWMQRATAEFTQLATLPQDMRDGQWHQATIPLYHDDQSQRVAFYFKQERHEKHRRARQDTDHFMVDITLSHLGRIQLDGLIQQRAASTQWDMAIRTQSSLPSDIRQGIMAIYAEAQHISGFSGGLRFLHGDSIFIIPPITSTPDDQDILLV